MDPISISHLVQDRIDDLLRTADQVRRERSLRSKPAPATATATATETASVATATAPRAQPARPAEPRPSACKAADCTSAEHAA